MIVGIDIEGYSAAAELDGSRGDFQDWMMFFMGFRQISERRMLRQAALLAIVEGGIFQRKRKKEK
jgi:hypothetical protein